MSSASRRKNHLPSDSPICTSVARRLLRSEGILATDDVLAPNELANLNAVVDPIFARKFGERRSYAHPDELIEAGVWDLIFSTKMRSLLFSIMPDPVLYHCHIYEIAGDNPMPHIFGESMAGWHYDVEEPEKDATVFANGPTHVSVFVYLTDVGPRNGAFEFLSTPSRKWLVPGAPYVSALGNAGYTFVWNREFFHRASPNQSETRRRLLKLSIQRNQFPSSHLANQHFQRVLRAVLPGDVGMDILLGRYQGGTAPPLTMPDISTWRRIAPNAKLNMPLSQWLFPQLRKRFSALKKRVIPSSDSADKTVLRG